MNCDDDKHLGNTKPESHTMATFHFCVMWVQTFTVFACIFPITGTSADLSGTIEWARIIKNGCGSINGHGDNLCTQLFLP